MKFLFINLLVLIVVNTLVISFQHYYFSPSTRSFVQDVLNVASNSLAETESSNKTSKALGMLSQLRKKTDGNGLRYDGSTVDTQKYRDLWKESAQEILDLLPNPDELLDNGTLYQAYTEAVMYRTASKGIIYGITSGNAFTFLKAVDMMVKNHPKQDNGVAYIFEGAYYLAAPWPVRSSQKAMLSFQKALAVEPNSRRNIYYTAVAALAAGQKSYAGQLFKRAITATCMSPTEEDIGNFLESEAMQGLAALGS